MGNLLCRIGWHHWHRAVNIPARYEEYPQRWYICKEMGSKLWRVRLYRCCRCNLPKKFWD